MAWPGSWTPMCLGVGMDSYILVLLSRTPWCRTQFPRERVKCPNSGLGPIISDSGRTTQDLFCRSSSEVQTSDRWTVCLARMITIPSSPLKPTTTETRSQHFSPFKLFTNATSDANKNTSLVKCNFWGLISYCWTVSLYHNVRLC